MARSFPIPSPAHLAPVTTATLPTSDLDGGVLLISEDISKIGSRRQRLFLSTWRAFADALVRLCLHGTTDLCDLSSLLITASLVQWQFQDWTVRFAKKLMDVIVLKVRNEQLRIRHLGRSHAERVLICSRG